MERTINTQRGSIWGDAAKNSGKGFLRAAQAHFSPESLSEALRLTSCGGIKTWKVLEGRVVGHGLQIGGAAWECELVCLSAGLMAQCTCQSRGASEKLWCGHVVAVALRAVEQFSLGSALAERFYSKVFDEEVGEEDQDNEDRRLRAALQDRLSGECRVVSVGAHSLAQALKLQPVSEDLEQVLHHADLRSGVHVGDG